MRLRTSSGQYLLGTQTPETQLAAALLLGTGMGGVSRGTPSVPTAHRQEDPPGPSMCTRD